MPELTGDEAGGNYMEPNTRINNGKGTEHMKCHEKNGTDRGPWLRIKQGKDQKRQG